MNTLDEVIKALEMCTADNCVCLSGCPYSYLADGDDGCEYHAIPAMQTDALYYLKWFRARDNMSRKLDREDNEPLTWSELKQMFHKPVWIETTAKKGWNIIVSIDSTDMQVIHTAHRGPKQSEFSKTSLGKTWQAYRKEKNV